MKKFWGYVSNGNFSVGCTGQTVYLYDKGDNEIGKFKDITYGYTPMISPDGRIFVVKSTDGRLAVYSLETRSLIKKFRFSKVDGAQDDGFCFSPDGKFFINIERQKDDLHQAISVYDTSDFSLVKQIMLDEDMMLNYIEFDKTADTYYVSGIIHNTNENSRCYFVAELKDLQIQNITAVPEEEYDIYNVYKDLELMGFTEKKYEWCISYRYDYKLEEFKNMNLSLSKLYKIYNK
ncbi:MAG: hypothetical protein J6V78_03410 [Clostridia bacterium]|nr:hypothetical protein [Clostridia bacterium]